MSPVDALLNTVEWIQLDVDGFDKSDELPYATHAGTVRIGGVLFRCYQLSDGRRVVDSDDINKFFGIGDE